MNDILINTQSWASTNTSSLLDDKLTEFRGKLRAELTYKLHYLIGYINTNNISNEPPKTNQQENSMNQENKYIAIYENLQEEKALAYLSDAEIAAHDAWALMLFDPSINGDNFIECAKYYFSDEEINKFLATHGITIKRGE